MTAPSRPNALSTLGRRNWIFLLSVSAIATPTATEVNAAGGIDISNILFDGSFTQPTQTTNRVTPERRVGDTSLFEFIGLTTYQGGDMAYQFDAQAAAATAGKKAYEKFLGGVSGFLVDRLGLTIATTPAAGQFVNVWPVQLGPSIIMTVGSGETQEAAAQCTYAVTSAPSLNVALT